MDGLAFQQQQPRPLPNRKRKADAPPPHNDRLSKRLSLLNLEQSGAKLYVPVENSQLSASPVSHATQSSAGTAASSDIFPVSPAAPTHENPLVAGSSSLSLASLLTAPPVPAAPVAGSSLSPPRRRKPRLPRNHDDSSMQLDDSKYKVYIYNLDDELSSEGEDPEDGRLVFLPDIEKHLRATRVPAHVLYNGSGGSGAGVSAPTGMEVVLYSVPRSLSVPEEHDSVRKAILEARARARKGERVAASEAEGAMDGLVAVNTNTSNTVEPPNLAASMVPTTGVPAPAPLFVPALSSIPEFGGAPPMGSTDEEPEPMELD